MKRAFLSLLLIMAAGVLMAKETAVRDFPVSGFRSIEASSAVEVRFYIGEVYSVKAEGEEKDIEQHVVECKDGTLKICVKNSRKTRMVKINGKRVEGESIGRVVFHVTAPESPNRIRLSGASVFQTNSVLEAQRFSVRASGASLFNGNTIKAEKASFGISGASKCRASIEAEEVDVECSGASHGSLNIQCQLLDAEASGASSLTLKGSAQQISVNSSGASSINKKGLILRKE